MSVRDNNEAPAASKPVFFPNTYRFVVPFTSADARTKIGKRSINLFTTKKPESLDVTRVERVNSDEVFDARSWRFDEIEQIPGGPSPSFAVRLYFDGADFMARLHALDDEIGELDCAYRGLSKADASAERADLKKRIEKLEKTRAPLSRLFRAFVLGAKLHFQIRVDGVVQSLFLSVDHRVPHER